MAHAKNNKTELRGGTGTKRVARLVLALVLAIAWMTVIFQMSAGTADESSEMSGGLINTLLTMLFGSADPQLAASLQHPIRKLAHFVEYAVLGFLLANAVRSFVLMRGQFNRPFGGKLVFLTWLIGVLYALTDEFHQSFVPGRSMEFRDICIDASGVLFGVLIFALAVKLYASHRRKASE